MVVVIRVGLVVGLEEEDDEDDEGSGQKSIDHCLRHIHQCLILIFWLPLNPKRQD